MPSSAYEKFIANPIQYLTANPQGAGMQAFTKMMLDTADRERATASRQLKNAQLAKAGAGENALLNFPGINKDQAKATFEQRLADKGIDPEEYYAFKKGTRVDAVKAGVSAQNGVSAKPQSNNTSKPKTVTQNGHTYTLNESTGQYE